MTGLEILPFPLNLLKANLPATGTALDPLRFGVEPNRQALDVIIGYAYAQGMIPKRFSVDELFDDTTRALTAAELESVSGGCGCSPIKPTPSTPDPLPPASIPCPCDGT